MNDLKVLRWTGRCGVVAGLLLMLAILPYNIVVGGGGTVPSPGNEALFTEYVIRSNTIHFIVLFVEVVCLVGFMVFAAGLRYLIRRVHPDYEWLATLVFGSALVMTATIMIFEALWGGAILDTFSKPDSTVIRGLTEAAIASQAFGLILTALFLAAAGYAILATRALPRGTGEVCIIFAVASLVAIPLVRVSFNTYPLMIVNAVFFTGFVSSSMTRVKQEDLSPEPRERELQEVQ